MNKKELNERELIENRYACVSKKLKALEDEIYRMEHSGHISEDRTELRVMDNRVNILLGELKGLMWAFNNKNKTIDKLAEEHDKCLQEAV